MTNKEREQRVAAEILVMLIMCKGMPDVRRVIDDVFDMYELAHDPFTGLPCTQVEYFQNRREYERQTMIEAYGHCDGLE